jgi:hypothetical protein
VNSIFSGEKLKGRLREEKGEIENFPRGELCVEISEVGQLDPPSKADALHRMFLIDIDWMGTLRSRVVNPTTIKTIHSEMASKASNVMRGA